MELPLACVELQHLEEEALEVSTQFDQQANWVKFKEKIQTVGGMATITYFDR